MLKSHSLKRWKQYTYGKNSFADVSKNLVAYRLKNNFIVLLK